MFETPILLITFNRPKHAATVLAEIKKQKPKNLYIFQDGPRENVPDDQEKCAAVKKLIQEEVDWDCNLKTLYQDENLGCGYGPAKAITWLFENEEMGIILEDDCLPGDDFFPFCASMLSEYKIDEKTSVISGTNALKKYKSDRTSHIITKYGSTWGWATWRRAWSLFDHDMNEWKTETGKNKLEIFVDNTKHLKYFENLFDEYSKPDRKHDVWDYQWLFCRLINETYSIVPTVNLVSNIGFGLESHHTTNPNDRLSSLPIQRLRPIIYPEKLIVDNIFDILYFELFLNPRKRSFIKRIIIKLLKIIYHLN